MKHLSFLYNDIKSYKAAKKEAKKSKYNSILIQLFSATTKKKLIKQMLTSLKKDFPSAAIIGTTTAGEISKAKMYENETVVSLSLFKKTELSTYRTDEISKKSGKKLSAKITTKETKAAVILSEGLKGSDYEGFIKSVKSENPNIILAGGLAGDNFALKKTYIFMDDKIYSSGAVGVSFSGKSLIVNNDYNLNWNPIGKEFTITKVTGNILSEIDGKNAIELMKHYLGKTLFENNCTSLPDFQLLYKEGNTVVSRTPMTTDGENIILAGPIKKGQKIQFGFSNATSIISGANAITTKLNKSPAEAIYIYSCIARKTLLGKKLESEFSSFEQLAPTAGFFTYGEFYSTDIDNALLNCTTTILLLSETKKGKQKKLPKKQENTLSSITFNALTHFIKQTSKELQENATLLKEYKDVVDESSLVSKTDLSGNIIYVNDTFSKVSQYSREELIGQNHNIIRDPNMSKFVFKKLWDNIKKGKIWRGVISNIAKDGSLYYVSATIMPIFDANHKIKEFIAIRQDITKQIESKKRIQEKEKLIKAIFDNQDAMVIYASKEKGMLSVNKKLFELLNFSSFEEFKEGHSCICDLFLEEEGYVYVKKYPNWLDAIANGTLDIQSKVKMIVKDGSKHTFTVLVKQIDNRYIINLHDITQLENAMLKAYASEQAKTIFLANMSHEIRTPLNGILGFTDILTKRDLGKEEKRYIDIIHKSGQTLLHVVNDILDFSKLESGELVLYETESDLFAEMEATVSTFSSLSKNKQVNYYVYTDTTIPKLLKCDVQRLKQVVNNLVSNAIKFTPADGEVHVNIHLKSLINKKAKIHFSVKDSGIGIAKEKQKTIFDAFSQADNSISREFGGTGLGLAISSQYINMMGSQIQLTSSQGEGSEFFFDLELDVVDESSSITQITNNNNINIAVIHLDTTLEGCAVNNIVFSYLDAWGYEYTKAQQIEDIPEETDIVIICSKIFDLDACKKVLDRYEKLHLIYIEGVDGEFTCNHERSHCVEQPMTGSALFDKIITLTQDTTQLLSSQNSKQVEDQQFQGHILIAEDNQTNQILISLLLKERGLEYTLVDNGQKAIDAALKHEYDLIFMDINMPILDGLSATKELRKQKYKAPIVSLSANVIESDLLSFKEAGVNDSLNKPIIPTELDKVLSTYLPPANANSVLNLYDTIDVEKISSALKIADKTIILTLIKSFTSSLIEIKKSIEEEGITADILHNLKGMVGNLRFTEFEKFLIHSEEEYEEWDDDAKEKQTQELLKHIEQILAQAEEL